MILEGRNETGRPRKNWDTLSIRGRLLGGATARLRNPKRAEALGGNAFSVVWVQCIQTTCGENAVKCRIME